MTFFSFIENGPLDMIMGTIVISNAAVMFAWTSDRRLENLLGLLKTRGSDTGTCRSSVNCRNLVPAFLICDSAS